MDRPNGEGPERLRTFEKDDFEADWIRVAERDFGKVYKGKLKLWRETCAVKCFSDTLSGTTILRRMKEEASTIEELKIKYIVSIFGVCNDPPAVVTEYMSNGSLNKLLMSHILMWPKKFRMIHEITMGMNFLHSMAQPLLHLNLKPANVLLDNHLHCKISDFGLIKLDEASSVTELVEHLTARGNLPYIPPESFPQNPEPPGNKFDVYSFSIVVWEILAQRKAYSGCAMIKVLTAVSSGKRPTLEMIPEDKPPECNAMIELMQMCWNQDWAERPAFSDIVRETEALTEVLELPVKIDGTETETPRQLDYGMFAINKRKTKTKTNWGSDGDAGSDILTLLAKKDFEGFRATLGEAHASVRLPDGLSLLHYAAASGDGGSVEHLLNLGSRVDAQSDGGYTPLIAAVLHRHPEVCALLVERGADVNLGDADRWTPLHFAAQNGDERAVRLLLGQEARPCTADKYGWTPLHLSAQNGHEGVVRVLLPRLQGGGDNLETRQGRTPLHTVCAYGHLSIADLLLSYGANSNATDYSGITPLHLAAKEGHSRVVRLLLSRGADVGAVDSRGYSALHTATLSGRRGICRLLLSKGAEPNQETARHWTPVHLASLRGQADTVFRLEEHGGCVNAQGEKGMTPLHLACRHGQEAAATALLTSGADPNVAEEGGWTPLHLAAHGGSFRTVLELISHRACVNAQNDSQATALHLAARKGSLPIVQALLMNGADRNIVDSRGCTAYALAVRLEKEEMVQLLTG